MATPATGPSASYWDRIYAANGSRVVATRVSPDEYLASGARDVQTLLALAGRDAPLGRVLEIGAGDGRMSTAVAPLAEHLVCLEPARRLARTCGDRLAGRSNVEVLVGASSALDELADASFDFVYSWCVFQHVPEREEIAHYLERTGHLLAPGGVGCHQFRMRSAATLVHQLATDLARIPSRMPKFSAHWRGGRFRPDEILELAEPLLRPGQTADLTVGPIHGWLKITAPQAP